MKPLIPFLPALFIASASTLNVTYNGPAAGGLPYQNAQYQASNYVDPGTVATYWSAELGTWMIPNSDAQSWTSVRGDINNSQGIFEDHSAFRFSFFNLVEGEAYQIRSSLNNAFELARDLNESILLQNANSGLQKSDWTNISPKSRSNTRTVVIPTNTSRLRGYTLAEVDSDGSFSKRSQGLRFRDLVTKITHLEDNTNTTIISEEANTDQEISQFIYIALQYNASQILLPILKDFLYESNSQLVYDAAWSVYTELTGSSQLVLGPYLAGANCIDSIERHITGNNQSSSEVITALRTKENLTGEDLQKLRWYTVHSVLTQVYAAMYQECLAAVNATGLVDELWAMMSYILPDGSASLPVGLEGIQTTIPTAFFTAPQDIPSLSDI